MIVDEIIEKMEEFDIEVKHICGTDNYKMILLDQKLVLDVRFFEAAKKLNIRFEIFNDGFLNWPTDQNLDSVNLSCELGKSKLLSYRKTFTEDQFLGVLTVIKKMLN